MENQLFIAEFDTTQVSPGSSNSKQVTLPLVSGVSYDFIVYWGDGSISEIKDSSAAEKTHTYEEEGVYDIKIIGSFPQLAFYQVGVPMDVLKVLDVKQWGTNTWSTMRNMFAGGCKNLQMSAADAPDLSNVTDLVNMFGGATTFNGSIGHWDTSNVKDMMAMFSNARAFNQDIGEWDTSNVKSMIHMFNSADSFNQDIGRWNTANVTSMRNMFLGTNIVFNQDLSGWGVGNVEPMHPLDFYIGVGGSWSDAIWTLPKPDLWDDLSAWGVL